MFLVDLQVRAKNDVLEQLHAEWNSYSFTLKISVKNVDDFAIKFKGLRPLVDLQMHARNDGCTYGRYGLAKRVNFRQFNFENEGR